MCIKMIYLNNSRNLGYFTTTLEKNYGIYLMTMTFIRHKKIPMILESCTEDDRYAILEVMAFFLWTAYDQGGLSGDITKSIRRLEDSLTVNSSHRVDPDVLDTLQNEYEAFIQNRKSYFRVGSRHNEGTAMHGLVTVFWGNTWQ